MDAKRRNSYIILAILSAIALTLTGLLIGYVKAYFYGLIFGAIALMIVLYVVGVEKKIEWLYKCMLTGFYIGIVILALALAVIRSGLIYQFYDETGKMSAAKVSEVIKGKKSAAFIFIMLSFLQVTFLPIPSTVLTVVGAALFGIGRGIVFSLIGQVVGSMVAFALGRFFGKKIIVWIVGADAFDKYNEIIKGRDKIVIIFMLLLPFFPDDLLCMFAGLTTFSWVGFFLIVLVARTITISYTSFGYGALDAVKQLGAWSYVIYIVFALLVVLLFIAIWKKGDVIEEKMLKLIDKITPKRFKKQPVAAESKDDESTDDNAQAVIENPLINDCNQPSDELPREDTPKE